MVKIIAFIIVDAPIFHCLQLLTLPPLHIDSDSCVSLLDDDNPDSYFYIDAVHITVADYICQLSM